MITEPASRLLLLAIEAVQREAALRISAMVDAAAIQEGRLPGEWQLDLTQKAWIKKEKENA